MSHVRERKDKGLRKDGTKYWVARWNNPFNQDERIERTFRSREEGEQWITDMELVGATVPDAISWSKSVDLGRALARLHATVDSARSARSWRWADLLLAIAPVGKAGRGKGQRNDDPNKLDKLLLRWKLETGCPLSINTMKHYRSTARLWPVGKRIEGASFGAHEKLRNHPERFDLLRPDMTSAEAGKLAKTSVIRMRTKGQPTSAVILERLQGAVRFAKSAMNEASDGIMLDRDMAEAILAAGEELSDLISDLNQFVYTHERVA